MAKVSSILAKRKEAWIWFACQVLFLAIFFDIHEEHLMQALAFLHAWNFLNIMHFPNMGMQAI